MLLTENLNQWKLLLEREMRGETVNMEPGYAEFYAEWKQEKGDTLEKLSAEERVQLFSDDLALETKKEMDHLIDKKWSSSDKKAQLKTQAAQGDLLLVSTDEGKHFDQVMTTKELSTQDSTRLRFLSPTLTSVTNNYEALKEEQNLLHVSKQLRSNHCLVERGYVENHMVHVDIIHARMQASTVEVDLTKDASARDYFFKAKNEKEGKHVSETQLPEEFGLIEPESNVEKEIAMQALLMQEKTEKEKELEGINNAGINILSTVLTLQKTHSRTRAQEAAALLQEQNSMRKDGKVQVQFPREELLRRAEGRYLTNVIAAKATIATRIAEQQVAHQAEVARVNAAILGHHEAQKKMIQLRAEQVKKKKEKMVKDQQKRKAMAGIGAALTGGAVSGAGLLGWWVTHISSL